MAQLTFPGQIRVTMDGSGPRIIDMTTGEVVPNVVSVHIEFSKYGAEADVRYWMRQRGRHLPSTVNIRYHLHTLEFESMPDE